MKNLWDLKRVFSNLELEGQGFGIIMEVTRLLLLGPFYYIQTNFSILFCTQLYEYLTLFQWIRGWLYPPNYFSLPQIANLPTELLRCSKLLARLVDGNWQKHQSCLASTIVTSQFFSESISQSWYLSIWTLVNCHVFTEMYLHLFPTRQG